MALQSIQGLGPNVRGVVLVCSECKKPRAHYKAPNGVAICGTCGQGHHPCLGQCGKQIPVEHALCDACEDRLR